MSSYHQPVLLKECIEGLQLKKGGIYVDATFGGGGHSKEILKSEKEIKLYAFDQDEDATANVPDDERLVFVKQNFRYLNKYLKLYNTKKIDGILLDLGISSYQIDTPERGFSIRFDGPLDMRMNNTGDNNAADIINNASVEELQNIFGTYGEIRNARTLAETIVGARENDSMNTIEAFKAAIKNVIRGNENRYLAQVFQALRIAVNDELDALKDLLMQTLELLAEGGRLVVLSYHSLEDRLVKNFIKTGNFEGEVKKDFYGNISRPFKLINKKPILASAEEIKENKRARSAKLRIAERILS